MCIKLWCLQGVVKATDDVPTQACASRADVALVFMTHRTLVLDMHVRAEAATHPAMHALGACRMSPSHVSVLQRMDDLCTCRRSKQRNELSTRETKSNVSRS
jgi:hypothetical protein